MSLNKCNAVAYWLKMYKHQVPYAILLSILSPIIIILNLSLIVSFIATRQVTQNASNILICAISVLDLATGSVAMPLTAKVLLHLNEDDTCANSRVLIIFSSCGQASMILTAFLALDRYLHMNPNIQNHPPRIKKILKPPNIYYVLAIVFISTNALSFTLAFQLNQQLTSSISSASTILLSIQLIFTSFLYTRGYLRIRTFADNNPVYNEPMGSTPDYVRKLYKTVLVIVVLALIQHVPYCVAAIMAALHNNLEELSSHPVFTYFFYFASLSAYAGSFTNCMAILHFNIRAKNWILQILGLRKMPQQGRQG